MPPEMQRQDIPTPAVFVPLPILAVAYGLPHVLAPSPAALVRSGQRKTIRLRFESGGLKRFPVDLRAISCQYGATDRPPRVDEFDTLPPDIDVVLYPACPVGGSVTRLSFGNNIFRYTRRFTNFVVDVEGTFDTYWSRFSSKSRWAMKSKAKKLNKFCGEVSYRECRSAEEMKLFYELARKVELGSFQRKVLQNCIPDDPAFYKEMLDLASDGKVRGYLLLAKDKPIAYLYCIASAQVLFHELSGYDSALGVYSPGVLLQRYALEQVFGERRFRLFDFSSGGGQHKEFFSTRRLERADVYIFRKTWRNLVIASFVAGAGFALTKLTGVLGRVGLQARFIRVMRCVRQGLVVAHPVADQQVVADEIVSAPGPSTPAPLLPKSQNKEKA